MEYRTHLLQHLAQYKQTVLGITKPGIFRYRGRELKREHILPYAKKWHNIPDQKRGLVQAYLDQHPQIKLHRYFHHLNSSQALAFSLFIPFFEAAPSASAALLRAFGISGTLRNWVPEAVPDQKEGTNLDVQWSLADGTTFLCEVKLSEGDFGKAKNDDRHANKLREIYRPGLHGHVEARLLKAPAFFSVYQMLRNVYHMVAVPNSTLVFLLPKGNDRLWNLLLPTLEAVTPSTRNRISIVAIEDVLRHLQMDKHCPCELREYAKILEHKYVPTNSIHGATPQSPI